MRLEIEPESLTARFRKMGKEVSRAELTKFALKLIVCFRGQAEGLFRVKSREDWSKEELNGVADLLRKAWDILEKEKRTKLPVSEAWQEARKVCVRE